MRARQCRARQQPAQRQTGARAVTFAHELSQDAKGVAFAYGGVDPGTIHAGGRLVRFNH